MKSPKIAKPKAIKKFKAKDDLAKNDGAVETINLKNEIEELRQRNRDVERQRDETTASLRQQIRIFEELETTRKKKDNLVRPERVPTSNRDKSPIYGELKETIKSLQEENQQLKRKSQANARRLNIVQKSLYDSVTA